MIVTFEKTCLFDKRTMRKSGIGTNSIKHLRRQQHKKCKLTCERERERAHFE